MAIGQVQYTIFIQRKVPEHTRLKLTQQRKHLWLLLGYAHEAVNSILEYKVCMSINAKCKHDNVKNKQAHFPYELVYQ